MPPGRLMRSQSTESSRQGDGLQPEASRGDGNSSFGTSYQMELDCRRLTKSRYSNAVEEYPCSAPLRVNSPVIGFIC
jgi:hypothetical protein